MIIKLFILLFSCAITFSIYCCCISSGQADRIQQAIKSSTSAKRIDLYEA